MLIKNFRELDTCHAKHHALKILESGLMASLPRNILKKFIHKKHILLGKKPKNLSRYGGVFVVAFGKAADSMTSEVSLLTKINGGIVVIPKGYISLFKRKSFEIVHSTHPIPNKISTVAAKTIIKFLMKRKENELVIFLVSGGASSLVSLPDGVTLDEKGKITKLLLNCGANIEEINCVRKHLSKIKGGKMLGYLRCDAVSFVMSDVVGDDISSIASGITSFDRTTFNDALKVLSKYNLLKSVPPNVLKHFKSGLQGKISETPKRQKIKNQIVATNKDCLFEMEKRLKSFGFTSTMVYPISGDVEKVAKTLAKAIKNKKSKSCIIFGGETTVKVTGNGRGGRNQELVLYLLKNLEKVKQEIIISSINTDGMDGNSDACGAILSNKTKFGQANQFLKINDSYSFLKKNHGLIFTGPNHTNLMDFGLLLKG